MIIPFSRSSPQAQDAPSETNLLMALAEMQKQGRLPIQNRQEWEPNVKYNRTLQDAPELQSETDALEKSLKEGVPLPRSRP